jgi:hypothetical protein
MNTKQRVQRKLEPFTFDVTCVIGTVEVGNGSEAPHVVAMKLIAEHDAEGTFTFPMADGRTQRVTVEFVDTFVETI